ncbi:MAG: pseudouridine synthase [Planctomycetota bacterium]
MDTTVRLNKYLAVNGIASRRHADRLIADGDVMVNGEIVTELGLKIDPETTRVEVDGVVLKPHGEHKRYYLLNKPKGVVCTNEIRETRRRAIDLIGDRQRGRIFTVGRLDEDTEGLIILTNDGEFANKIAHPRHGIAKTYQVHVKGRVEDASLERLREGVRLSDYRARFRDVRLAQRSEKGSLVYVTLEEGRNREVRRAFVALGHDVLALARVQVGPLHDRKLRVGQWRPLLREEIDALVSEEARHAPQVYTAPKRRMASTGRRGASAVHARKRAAGGRLGQQRAEQRETDQRREALRRAGQGAGQRSDEPEQREGPLRGGQNRAGQNHTGQRRGEHTGPEGAGEQRPRQQRPGQQRPEQSRPGQSRPGQSRPKSQRGRR